MGYREDTFKARFENAAKTLGTEYNQVISIKIRGGAPDREYVEFFQYLKRELRLHSTPISVEPYSKGHLVSNQKDKVILVEHETGLEILYIAGAIASLVGLIPLIVQAWRFLRNHSRGGHYPDYQDIEIRRFDENGNLDEKSISSLETNDIISIGSLNSVFIHLFKNEIENITSQIKQLVSRVEKLEKHKSIKSHKRKTAKTRKSITKE